MSVCHQSQWRKNAKQKKEREKLVSEMRFCFFCSFWEIFEQVFLHLTINRKMFTQALKIIIIPEGMGFHLLGFQLPRPASHLLVFLSFSLNPRTQGEWFWQVNRCASLLRCTPKSRNISFVTKYFVVSKRIFNLDFKICYVCH